MNIQTVIDSIRNVPDFPKPGVMFKDITTAMKEPDILRYLADTLYELYKDKGITKVVGVESRGFVLGSILAYRLHAGFVLLRKPGKLPAETYTYSYDLEYGQDALEIHKDAIEEGEIVLLHDDLLATGGSANAALKLINMFNPKEIHASFMIELSSLKGKDKLQGIENLEDIHTLIQF